MMIAIAPVGRRSQRSGATRNSVSVMLYRKMPITPAIWAASFVQAMPA